VSTLAWPLILLALAVLLLIAEVFVPSGGAIGLLAAGCLILSLWQAFSQSTRVGLNFLMADFILLPVVFSVALYLWPKTPLAKRVFLKPPDPEEVAVAHPAFLDHLIGQLGRAVTPLRPSGAVEFDGRRLDGLAEEGLIASGSPVKAVRIRSGQVVVRAVSAPPPVEPPTATHSPDRPVPVPTDRGLA
jgi:membrane-bound serine protease (ClpP class)